MSNPSWKMPRSVPPFSMLLADLGNPQPRQIAKTFQVSERTARRWVKNDNPPFMVLLATYWLTSWGREEVHCEAENAARMHTGLYEALRRENAALKVRIQRLEDLGEFESANQPFLQEVRA